MAILMIEKFWDSISNRHSALVLIANSILALQRGKCMNLRITEYV